MNRSAEHSLQGYVYQFLKYLSALLTAEQEAVVTIEGAIEDIDIASSDRTTAIQCKYHGSVETFTLSAIYKPILLMLEHFSKNAGSTVSIHYNLFCHFPNERDSLTLNESRLDSILATKDQTLCAIISRVQHGYDKEKFLSRISITFGPSLLDIEHEVIDLLTKNGFDRSDVEDLIYPAAFQK